MKQETRITVECHVCQANGKIVRMPAIFCSGCRGGIDIEMTEEEIAEYNAKRESHGQEKTRQP